METMKRHFTPLSSLFASVFAFAFIFVACHLGQETKVENTLSFSKHYDSLAAYDSVVIEVKDPDGKSIAVVYAGKVDSRTEIDNLDVPGWDGGAILIVITGYDADKVEPIYKEEKRYNGQTRVTGDNDVLIYPNPGLASTATIPPLSPGQILPLPQVSVVPANLQDRGLLWSSDLPAVVEVRDNQLIAGSPGTARVTVKLHYDTTKTLVFSVQVQQGAQLPVERVRFQSETLELFVGGTAVPLAVEVTPATANQQVDFQVGDTAVASLAGNVLSPRSQGATSVIVRSRENSSKSDTLQVTVTVPVQVQQVVVTPTTLTLYKGGVSRSAAAAVLPAGAPQGVKWTSLSPTIASVSEQGEVRPLLAGQAIVVATSLADSSKKDSLTATVFDARPISIDQPLDNSYTNKRVVDVVWSVNGRKQDSLLTETLKDGANIIRRQFRDAQGTLYADSITVHLDTVPPSAPRLAGTSPTNSKPKWTWSSGGSGGSGDFRYRLGNAEFPANAPTVRDTAFILATDPVPGTTYTLFVQERDAAGNWSPTANLAIVFDDSKPVVTIASPAASGTFYTSSARIPLLGTASGPLPVARVTYKVGSGAAANATLAAGSWNTSEITLTEGTPVLVTVTAIDNAGNSGEASLTLFMDNTAPSAPVISTGPAASLAESKASFGWTAGSDGASGSGLNGRYRYNLNGGPWKDTSATLLADLPLVEGNNVFSVQEQDRAKLWSVSATRLVKVDTSGPVITLTSHSNPAALGGLNVTLAGQVRDTGTGVATMTVSGQASGAGAVTVTGTTWTSAALTLISGRNTLLLTATDALGNVRTLSVVLNVNVAAPAVVITSPANGTLTNLDTITVRYTIDAVAGSQRFTLTEGSNSLVIASPPNASGNIGRDTVTVVLDATAPLSPTLTSVGSSPTNGNATWNWTSRGDNTGGSGVKSPPAFRYQDNGGAWTTTSATTLTLTTEGTHSLVVQEQDRAGNWSLSSTARVIVIDRTGPVVAIITRNNFITNKSPASIRYRVDGTEQTAVNCALSTANNGSNLCSVTGRDALGNPTQASITVWYRPNTIFITKGGRGAGTSWEDASADLEGFVGNQDNANKEFWVAKGSYGSLFSAMPMTLLGGFDSTAYTTNNRDMSATFLDNMTADIFGPQTLDGVVFRGSLWVRIVTMTLNDVSFESALPDLGNAVRVIDGGNLIANRISIEGNTYSYGVIEVSTTSTATFSGGSIVSNNAGTGHAFYIGGTVNMKSAFSLYNNTGETFYQVWMGSGSRLVVDQGVNFDCARQVYNDGGTLSCKQ